MTARKLLSCLERVRCTGRGRWIARCPAHQDRFPSLSVRELDDGRVLVHDFGGCETHAVLDAVGLTWADLMPERVGGFHGTKRERRPLAALDTLRAVAFEVLIAATAAENLAAGANLHERDRDRLRLAYERLVNALELAGAI